MCTSYVYVHIFTGHIYVPADFTLPYYFDSRKHANDMIVNLSYERDRLSQLVKEEEEEMKRLSDILRIVEV